MKNFAKNTLMQLNIMQLSRRVPGLSGGGGNERNRRRVDGSSTGGGGGFGD